MKWRSVATQWATVLVLLAMIAAIQFFKPEWTGVEIGGGKNPDNNSNRRTYVAIDGDSFQAGDIEIRLHGIDAPEYRQTCKADSGATVPCGKLARDQLSKLIGSAHVDCRIIDRDRYGRQVSVCRDGKLDINREMVRLGWAVAYRRHALAYVAAEGEAQSAKRGIWAWSFEKPEDYRVRNRAVRGSAAGISFKDE